METFDRRPYQDSPYLVFPNGKPFRMRIGYPLQTLSAFVYQKADLFGDPLPLDLAGLTITVKIFNKEGQLIAGGPVVVTDIDLSQIEYTWSKFDIRNPGVYYAEFIFTDIDDTAFILPEKGTRLEIVAA